MKKIGLSFDIEDWFHVKNMSSVINMKEWHYCNDRVRVGTDYILTALDKKNIRATFFILGWVGQRHPDLIRKIASYGHEIASHGYNHQTLYSMTPSEFRDDLFKSIDILSAITKQDIKGYRAPSFSITKQTMWAFPILKEAGLIYDSSIFPIKHPDYGIDDFDESIQIIDNILEIPLNFLQIGPLRIPGPGGGYFRLYPFTVTKALLKRIQDKKHSVIYFHPWEFDESQPRLSIPFLKFFRHYVGLQHSRARFSRLLNEFEFSTLEEIAGLNLLEKAAS